MLIVANCYRIVRLFIFFIYLVISFSFFVATISGELQIVR